MVWGDKTPRQLALVVMAVVASVSLIGGCSSKASPDVGDMEQPQPKPTVEATAKASPDVGNGKQPQPKPTVEATPSLPSPGFSGRLSPSLYSEYFSTNQQIIEGLYSQTIDLRDVEAVFWTVFSHLPDEVVVYPSENYYYFKLFVDGRQIWGNIRLAAGRRELGQLSFAYFPFDEFSYDTGRKASRAKVFTAEDGVKVAEIDHFTYTVSYKKKTVKFNLLRLPQEPPRLFELGEREVFVERTFDESGYQFFLIFNEVRNYLFWVLNEEAEVPDILDPIGENGDVVRGRRSGFVFWEDYWHQDRKVLASIRQQSVRRNDYFDGPFDQLADNYADETRISEYIVKASPTLEGRIDKFGYFTDPGSTMRVALSTYFTHFYESQALEHIAAAKKSRDIYEYLARRGAIQSTPPATTPAPTATPQAATPTPKAEESQ
jgi:hypothetical protein